MKVAVRIFMIVTMSVALFVGAQLGAMDPAQKAVFEYVCEKTFHEEGFTYEICMYVKRLEDWEDVEKIDLMGHVEYTQTRREPTQAHIEWLEVDPEYQNQGVGSSLLQTALNKIQAMGIKTVSLVPIPLDFSLSPDKQEEARSRLIGFYEKFGFVNGGHNMTKTFDEELS